MPINDDFKTRAIMVGLAINIFVAGAAWGTLWTKVENLEKRLDRYHEDTRTEPYSKQSPAPSWAGLGSARAQTLTTEEEGRGSARTPSEAVTDTTSGEHSRERTRTGDKKRP